MSVSLQKIPGVELVSLSLKQGVVSIKLKPGNTVTLEQVRKAIRNDAFKPKEARVVVLGDLTPSRGGLEFKVTGTSEIFPVMATPHVSWQSQTGKQLLVDGLVAEPTSQSAAGSLQITSASSPSAANQ